MILRHGWQPKNMQTHFRNGRVVSILYLKSFLRHAMIGFRQGPHREGEQKPESTRELTL
jgi:hypothetical protein